MISIHITSEFQGYPWHSSPICCETAAERNRRANRERNAAREAEARRDAEWARILHFLHSTRFAGDDDRNHNRSRRNNPLAAQHTPRYNPYDYPSSSTPRSPRGVDASESPTASPTSLPPLLAPRPSTSAIDPRQNRAHQSTEPVIPPLPTTTPDPERTKVPVLSNTLQEPVAGQIPLITFDISRGPDSVAWRLSTLSLAWGFHDFNLPAAHPPIFEMTISVVVDDPLPKFDWPIIVSNPSGLTCGDVIKAIWEAFHEYVPKREYRSWDDQRKEKVKSAFFKRSKDPTRRVPVPATRECLRRIDYMSTWTGTQKGKGDGIMFRGMTPAFEATGGWLMFVGPQVPSDTLIAK